MIVDGLMDLECSKIDNRKRVHAAEKSIFAAAIEALVPIFKLAALVNNTVNWTVAHADRMTSLLERLNDDVTLFVLLLSHIALALAARRKSVEGTRVKMVSSNKRVKSKLRVGPLYAGPNRSSVWLTKRIMGRRSIWESTS